MRPCRAVHSALQTIRLLSPGGERVDRLQEPSARDFDPLAIHPAMAFGKKGRDHWADIAW